MNEQDQSHMLCKQCCNAIPRGARLCSQMLRRRQTRLYVRLHWKRCPRGRTRAKSSINETRRSLDPIQFRSWGPLCL